MPKPTAKAGKRMKAERGWTVVNRATGERALSCFNSLSELLAKMEGGTWQRRFYRIARVLVREVTRRKRK